MELNLKDKIAIVSGGNKGLGAASAEALAKEGAKLLLTARNETDLNSVKTELQENYGADVGVLPLDITEDGAGEKIVEAALEKFKRIDVIINAAGAARGGPVLGN